MSLWLPLDHSIEDTQEDGSAAASGWQEAWEQREVGMTISRGLCCREDQAQHCHPCWSRPPYRSRVPACLPACMHVVLGAGLLQEPCERELSLSECAPLLCV